MASIKREKLTYLIGLAIVAVAIVFVSVYLLEKDPNPLPKFISYFDRPGATLINYKTLHKGEEDQLWIDYRAVTAKQLLTDKRGYIDSIVLIRGEDVRTYIYGEDGLRKERLNKDNTPIAMLIMKAAKKGKLEKVKNDDSLVYYRIKLGKKADEKDRELAPQIALDEDTGIPKKTLERNNDDELVPFEILSAKHLSKSSAKHIFNMGELEPEDLKGRNPVLGYTAKDLRKFKRFTPYWLGPEVLGAKVTKIDEAYFDGKFSYLTIDYGTIKYPIVRITAYPARPKFPKSEYDFDEYWESYKIRFMVRGHRAVMSKEMNEAYIDGGGGIYKINSSSTVPYKKLISIIKRNFQQP